MLAKKTSIAVQLRRSFAASLLMLGVLLASPTVFSQNAVNTATVAPPGTVTDPNTANNSATDNDPIVRASNLSLTKTDSPDPVVVNDLLTYTLTVSNAGPSAILAASTFSIVESLPAGLTSCSFTPSEGTFSVGTIAPGATGTGTWTGADIPSGGSDTLTIVCTVTDAAAATITNTATVVPPTGTTDPDCSGSPVTCAGGNTASAGTTVNRPQLTITKAASAASFTVGVPASYTLTLQNTGSAATTAVATITDVVPSGIGIGTLPAGCTNVTQTVTCTVAAGLAAGGSVSFVIPITPTAAAASPAVNTASVSGGGDPTCPTDARCSSTTTTPINAPQLTLTKTAAPSPFVVGQPASYTLALQNTGSAATTAVATITDTIPTGLTIGTLPAGCSAAGQIVTCTVAAGLIAGGSTSFVIPVTPTAAALPSVTNTATVNGGGDPTCPAASRCAPSITTPVTSTIDAVDDAPPSVPSAGGTTPSVIGNDTTNGQPVVLTGPGTNASLIPGAAPTPAAGAITMNADGTITVAPGTTPGTYTYSYQICTVPATTPATCDTATATVTVSGNAPLTCPNNLYGSFSNGSTGPFSIRRIDPLTGIPSALTPPSPPLGGVGNSLAITPDGARAYYALSTTGALRYLDIVTNTDVAAGASFGASRGRMGIDPSGAFGYSSTTGTIERFTIPLSGSSAITPLTVVNAPGTPSDLLFTARPGGDLAVAADNSLYLLTRRGGVGPNLNDSVLYRAVVSGTTATVSLLGVITPAPGPANAPFSTLDNNGIAFVGNEVYVVGSNGGLYEMYRVDLDTLTAQFIYQGTPADLIPIDLASCIYATLAPSVQSEKTVAIVSPVGATVARAGYTLEYTITVRNSGNVSAANATFQDAVPAGTTYVASSTTLNGSPVADIGAAMPFVSPNSINSPGQPSGVLSPDQTPGTLDDEAVIRFRVVIGTGVTSVSNQGFVNYVGGPIGGVPTDDPTPPGATDPTVTPVAATTIDAIDDGPTTIPSTGGNTPSVIANDTTNGDPVVLTGPGTNATLTPGTAPTPAAGSITMNADGTITVAPGTTPGTYSYPYTICTVPGTTPATCDTATATVTVAPTIDAVDDGPATIPSSGGSTPSVIANDTTNGQPVVLTGPSTNASLIPGTAPTPVAGAITMNADGTITVAPGTTPGTYTYSYQICTVPATTPATCDNAIVTVEVTGVPQLTLTKAASAASFTVGVPASYTLTLQNTGTVATTAVATITDVVPSGIGIGTLPAGCTNVTQTVTCTVAAGLAAGGSVSFVIPITATAAAASPAVNTASVSGGGDPTCPADARCSSTTTTPINAPQLTITKTASAASFTVGVPASYTLNLQNTGSAATTAVATITDTIPAGLTIGTLPAGCSAAGQVVTCTVAAGLIAGGSTSFVIPVTPTAAAVSPVVNTASVSGGGDPTCPAASRCSSTTTTPVASTPIDAVNDGFGPVNGATGNPNVGNAFANDTLNGAPVNPAAIVATVTTPATPIGGGPVPTLNTTTGEVSVPAGTPAGPYTIVYQICEALNPTNCDSATITVTVTAAPIVAEDDSNAAPINGSTGGVAYPSVLNNNGNGPDTLNGVPATLATVTIAVIASSDPNVSLNPATGEVTVAPGTAAGTYTIDYEICEILNPTNCDPAQVTVTVTAAPIVANPDAVGGINGFTGAPAVINVLTNDTLNGVPVTLATVTITNIVPAAPIGGGPVPVLNPATGNVDVPAGTPAGVYTIGYTICENLNPTNCSTTTATITVVPPVIDAVNDDYSATPINGANGGSTASVLANDTLNGGPVTVGVGGNVTLTPGAAPTPAAGAITMNPDGTITVAAGTTAGTYTYPYTICEVLNPTNCDTATATVVVSAAPIDAVNDGFGPVNGATGNPNVGNAFANDTLNGAPVNPAAIVATVTTPATPIGGGPVPTLNTTTGEVSVPAGTPAGSYTIVYQICEALNPTNCDSATITVTVTAAPIVAEDDSNAAPINGSTGGVAYPSVLNNNGNGPDTLNGVPATLATVTIAVIASSDPNVSLNPATGEVTVAPGTAAGTYTIDYEICEILNPTNCDPAQVTVTVTAAPIVANPDAVGGINGFTGAPAVINVLTNDTLNGVPVTLATVTITNIVPAAPIGGGPVPVLNPATGNVDVPAGTPAGVYTITYTICEQLNPGNCSTTTATITVVPPVIDAVNDGFGPVNGATGNPNVGNAFANDTLNGAPVNPAAIVATVTTPATPIGGGPVPTLNTTTGEVSVPAGTPAGPYTIVYQICEALNPTNCDSATITVTVTAAPIVAEDDSNAAPINGSTGGVAYPSVLNNNGNGPDTLNGVPATLATVTIAVIASSDPNVSLNPATGEVTVAPGTAAGTYTIDYEICEILNPTNCDPAQVTVTVTAAPIVANPDAVGGINGFTGAPAVINVLTNDTLNGVPVTLATVTITNIVPAAPIGGGPVPVLNPATGNVDVPAGTPAGVYTITYTICEQLNPGNCSTTTATITVVPPVIDAVNDGFGPVNGATGNPNVGNAFANDTLNGAPVNPAAIVATVTTPATPIGGGPVPTLNTTTGEVSVPAGTPAGPYTIVYQICEALNPTNCDSATITVTVTAAPIVAEDDSNAAPINGSTGGVAYPSVLNNNGNGPDTLNGVPATLATVTIAVIASSDPNVSLNPATGEVTVAPGTAAGTYTIDYEICEILNPTNCDPAQVTVTVTAAPIVANPDAVGGINGFTGAPAVINVLTNDTLNGVPVTLATVTITNIVPAAPIGGGPVPVLNPATGNVDVPAGTPAGVYTITYTICEQLNPGNCSTTTATITVVPPVIDAVNDDYSATPINGANGGSTASVLANDTLNGGPVTVGVGGNVTLTPGAAPTPAAGAITMNPDGTITVAAGTTAGTYTYPYTICEVLNPTNCDTATATIVVSAAPIDAVDDTGTVANGAAGGVAVPNVLVNDTLNGVPATLATVTLTQVSTSNPNVTLNPATGAVNVAPGTPAGTYTLVYQICEILNPTNCDTATVTVTVGAAVIDAVNDNYGPFNGASGGTTTTVLINDTLGGNPVTVGVGGNVTLTPGAAPTPAAGAITMNPDGTITVAAGTTAGTYTYPYTICEVLNPTNCDTATATIVVTAAPIVAEDDSNAAPINGSTGGVAYPSVLNNNGNGPDTLNGVPATLATVTIAVIASSDPNVSLNPATGEVTVAPGTAAGTYTIDYEICEILNPTNCDPAQVTVTVTAAPIVANPDAVGGINGFTGAPAVINVLTNDTLNGVPVTLATVTITNIVPAAPIGGGPVPVLNPATGNVDVPAGTPAGVYTIGYTICENLNPTNCSTTTATITVVPPVIDAVNDDYSATPINGANGGSTASVLANDTLNGGPVTVGVGGNVTLTPGAAPTPAAGAITMNPDGTITVAAGTTAGTYTYPYTICEVLNPTNCDTATATVVVSAAPIDAVNDGFGPVNGATGNPNVGNAFANDTLNGAPVNPAAIVATVTTPATPIGGGPVPTLNTTTGEVSVPAGTPAGSYTIVYQICEALNPTNCDSATITVTVTAAPIVAEDDSNAAPINGSTGGVAYPSVLNNNGNGPDTLNGVPATLATVTIAVIASSDPNVSLNPATGEVTVAPGTAAGTYTIDYEICEILNPTNCDPAQVTVTVTAAPIVANPDAVGGINGFTGAPAVINVLTNDTLNGVPVTLATVTITNIVPAAPIGGGPVPVLNPATGNVDVPAGTPAGVYTITYTICEQLNPGNCSTTTATITVVPPVIDAVNDGFGPVNGATGNPNVGNAFANDTLNGAPVNPAAIVATVTTPATPIGGGPVPTLNTTTGEVSVPAGTPAGPYTIVYQICEALNPTNCDSATITVTVTAAPIVAEDDSNAAPINGSTGGVAYPSVLNNNGNGPDTLNGVPATLATVTIAVIASSDPNVSLNPATGEVTVAPGTAAGTYTIDYEICEILNPTNCDPAQVTVTVTAAPIVANPDAVGGINGFTGAPAVINVLTNDTLNGVPVTLATVTITNIVPAAPIGGGPVPVLNPATGNVDVPAGTPAGVYTITYTICEQLNPGNCSTTTATITVVPPVIDAVNDGFGPVNGATGNPNVGNAFANDTLNGAPVNPAAIVATVTTPATPIGGGPVPTLNTTTGEVSVPAGTPAGPYTIVYQICEALNPTNCDSATITVTVTAAPIVAEDDSNAAPINGSTGGVAYPSVLNNNGNGPDTLNGVPATLATVTIAVIASSDPNVSLNPATGEVTVAPGTAAGTYTIDYEICEILNPTNCDPAQVTVTVTAAPIVANPDAVGGINGFTGAPAVINVLTNDTLNGVPVTLATVTITNIVPAAPIGGGPVPVLNPATGNVDVPAGTPAGVYTITYTICEQLNPGNCSTTTATITVVPPVIDAVNDGFGPVNGATGNPSVGNAFANDTLNGAPVNPAAIVATVTTPATPIGGGPVPTLNTTTGEVSVPAGTPAGPYTIVYQICEALNPTNCDSATITVTVTAAPIVAEDDSNAAPINGSTGGVAYPSVLNNNGNGPDTLNGVPATLATVTIAVIASSDPNVSLNPATGEVTVAPGTAAGTYTIDYEICEILNPTNCDPAQVTVTVTAAPIVANPDAVGGINGFTGAPAVINVLTNDTLNGVPVTLATVTITNIVPAAPIGGGPVPVLNPATGNVDVPAGTPAGVYTIGYTICENLNPTNCSTTTATITVVPPVIDAVNDDYSATPINGANGGSTASVLANDTLNGGPVTVGVGGNVTLTPGAAPTPAAGAITMNPDGTITVAAGTTAGTYTYPYTICEVLNPTNCDTATATIVVSAAPIDAVDDTGTVANGAAGGVAVPNVLVNDTLNGVPATLATVTLTQVSTSNPNVTLNPATGAVNVAPGTPAGTYTLVYQICEILNPTNCDTATVTVTVGAAVIDAVNDNYGPFNGASGGTTTTVLINDTLGGNPVTVGVGGNVTLTPGAAPTPAAGAITMNPDGTITVAAGTTAGTYTYPYTICEVLNPTNCDTATATIVVTAAPIVAEDDSNAAPINGSTGGVAYPSVLNNNGNGPDTLNGVPATLATVTIAVIASSDPNVSLNPATGEVTVAPGTAAGTYTIDYEICEILNPTNCDPAQVTVTVTAAPIVANPDAVGGINGFTGAPAVINVLTNDTLNGVPVTLATVTITNIVPAAPIGGGPVPVLNPATGNVDVPAGTPAGVYTIGYTICENLNPTNCSTTTATITVVPPVIDAVNDDYSATPINGANGGSTASVLANDTLNGGPVTVGVGGNVTLTPGAAPTPAAGAITMNPDGTITVAAGTTAGTYTYPYTICEVLNPTNCDTATATVVVSAAPIVANPDTATGINGFTGAPGVVNVLTNDTLNGVPVTLATVTITTIVPATPINGGLVPVLNPATGLVDVPAGTPAGTYTITYTICENLNPTNCSTTTVTITVDAAPIVANDDTVGPVNGASGNPNAGNVFTNDTLNGVPVNPSAIVATVTTPATPINGGPVPTLDTATGNVSVPPGTPAGTYTIVYQICEILNPTNCDTATVTVTVSAAPIDAVDDPFPAVPATGGTTPSVLVNDTLNGNPVNPADVTLTPGTAPTPTSGSIVMNPDGTITVAPNTEAGTYTYPYTICEVLNPTNCDTAVATVIVSAAPALSIDKIAGTPSANAAGATIAYSFVVTNTGNVTVTGLVINDAQLSAPAVCPVTTLAPGASTTCTGSHTITQAEVDAGVVNNTATATGTLPGGGTLTSPPDSTSTTIVQTPALRAVKTATITTDNGVAGAADENDVVTYNVTITNSGNVTLTGLVVTDSLEGRPATTLTCTPTTLAPGASATCPSYTYTVTSADVIAGGTLDNIVTATARSANQSSQVVTATGAALVTLNGEPAQVRIVKTASPRDVKVGDLVRYTLTMENTGTTDVIDGTLIDTPPAGFTYVDGTLTVADADNAGRLVGTYPIRVDRIDIPGGERATITYLLRVGAGVRGGVHTNSAMLEDNGRPVSNVATADVQLVGDPLLDESLILGTVWNDRDGDQWQDGSDLSGVRIQGGFAADAYVANSTTVDRGEGPKPEPDASSPMLHGIDLGDIAGRQSDADAGRTITISQTLRDLRFSDDLVLTTAQGATLRMAADGSTRVETSGDAAKGLTAGMPSVERRVSQIADGYRVDYVIRNVGIAERGIPGVRLATVEGLLVETDQYGRYRLVGMDGGRWERGRNVIVKVDPATLPPGSTFTTDNPLVRRVTPGVPTRFDFGVKLPEGLIEGGEQSVEMELGEVMFNAESAELRSEYLPVIEKIAEQVRKHGNGEVLLAANGETQALAYDRAKAVQKALLATLNQDEAGKVKISLRTDLADPNSTLVSLGESPVLGTVLFDTDKSEIKPEFEPVIAKVAADIERLNGGVVGIIGHADKRGSAEYNVALGMRRAKAVYEAIAAKLSPGVRSKLRVDFSDNPTAPVGIRGQ